jgi:hypothetical protein
LRKSAEEKISSDRDDPDDRWALLADKAYVGPCGNIRMITPDKGVRNSEHNNRISRIRVHVERFFGRLKLLFCRMNNYTLDVNTLGTDFEICVQLTNIHLITNPLLEKDSEFYNSWLNVVMKTAESIREKRRLAQRKYIEKRSRNNQIIENVASFIEDDSIDFIPNNSQDEQTVSGFKKIPRLEEEAESQEILLSSTNKKRAKNIGIEPLSNSVSAASSELLTENINVNVGNKSYYEALNDRINGSRSEENTNMEKADG